jgi:hypothetical protein
MWEDCVNDLERLNYLFDSQKHVAVVICDIIHTVKGPIIHMHGQTVCNLALAPHPPAAGNDFLEYKRIVWAPSDDILSTEDSESSSESSSESEYEPPTPRPLAPIRTLPGPPGTLRIHMPI